MNAPAFPPVLDNFWPIFLLGQRGQDACKGRSALDLMYPDNAPKLRALFAPIFERVSLPAAAGLEATPDDELQRWANILRAPVWTGHRDELEFGIPAWAMVDGRPLHGITALFPLSPHQRCDIFLAAMAKKALT